MKKKPIVEVTADIKVENAKAFLKSIDTILVGDTLSIQSTNGCIIKLNIIK